MVRINLLDFFHTLNEVDSYECCIHAFYFVYRILHKTSNNRMNNEDIEFFNDSSSKNESRLAFLVQKIAVTFS